ncbi:uncharacterized protein N7496_010652 [Penicillium cataractarum]|uniref:Uncharacterized protein n=1 Tax=Penicillium cataractarum TaxID=2100454 RepID=A0A9W9RTX8_9EURO|nr:uncharacterized protein N7496_010652 [Penicillium cataractarum]KAJ5364939.1 hypothetical protein N7496_010652 [Penicillium cataractarum]
MELATFCELFAQLRETTAARYASTREFVDQYVLVVDTIQNDKDPVNPTTIGNRLANAEQTKTAKKCTYYKKRGYIAVDC